MPALPHLRSRRRVSVVGSGTDPLDPDAEVHVHEVATGLAERGWVLVTGGLAGTMAAAGAAYAEAGGPLHVGLLPGTDPDAADPHVDLPLPTGLGHARNALVAGAGDAVVAFPGGAGTLSELGFARIRQRPVVAVDAWAHVPGVEVVPDAREALAALDGVLDA